MPEIIENSVSYDFIRRVYSGCRTREQAWSLWRGVGRIVISIRTMGLARSLWRGIGRVMAGSRFIGFFKVDD